MKDGIIFVAGIYGVGKSTLCERLSISIGIPCYSAGDLISAINGEIYGRNKTVVNKEKNQDILVTAVNERLQKDKTFILAGHFCIFDKSFNVERLPESVFSLMSISKVVLLESDVTKVCENLRYRDSRCYPLDPYSIAELRKYRNPQMQSLYDAKIDAYTEMRCIAPQTAEFTALLSDTPKTANDQIDNQLLCELYCKRADILITEDRCMRLKADRLGLSERVFTINS